MTDFSKLEVEKPSLKLDGLITIAGVPGIGKSTFMSKCDRAIFMSCDGGLRALSCRKVDVTSWSQLLDEVKSLDTQFQEKKLDFEPVCVIDTIDQAKEMLLTDIRVGKSGKKGVLTISDYGEANHRWQTFMGYLSTRGFLVVALAHTVIKRAGDNVPAGWELVLGESSNRALAGRSDLLLLADKDELGVRMLRSDFQGGGKDRTGKLPAVMPLEWDAFEASWKKAVSEL